MLTDQTHVCSLEKNKCYNYCILGSQILIEIWGQKFCRVSTDEMSTSTWCCMQVLYKSAQNGKYSRKISWLSFTPWFSGNIEWQSSVIYIGQMISLIYFGTVVQRGYLASVRVHALKIASWHRRNRMGNFRRKKSEHFSGGGLSEHSFYILPQTIQRKNV